MPACGLTRSCRSRLAWYLARLLRTLIVHMNGLAFRADLLQGQKTGIFLDQRENYAAAARYAHGKALDCFTSTGGFALHMAPKCESVEAVDVRVPRRSHAAERKRAEQTASRNIEFREADVFDMLAGYVLGAP